MACSAILGNSLVDVGIQLHEHLDELLLVLGLIIAKPFEEGMETGIIDDGRLLTVSFIELALHRHYLPQAVPGSTGKAIRRSRTGLQNIPQCCCRAAKGLPQEAGMLCIVTSHDFEASAELLIGDQRNDLLDLHG